MTEQVKKNTQLINYLISQLQDVKRFNSSFDISALLDQIARLTTKVNEIDAWYTAFTGAGYTVDALNSSQEIMHANLTKDATMQSIRDDFQSCISTNYQALKAESHRFGALSVNGDKVQTLLGAFGQTIDITATLGSYDWLKYEHIDYTIGQRMTYLFPGVHHSTFIVTQLGFVIDTTEDGVVITVLLEDGTLSDNASVVLSSNIIDLSTSNAFETHVSIMVGMLYIYQGSSLYRCDLIVSQLAVNDVQRPKDVRSGVHTIWDGFVKINQLEGHGYVKTSQLFTKVIEWDMLPRSSNDQSLLYYMQAIQSLESQVTGIATLVQAEVISLLTATDGPLANSVAAVTRLSNTAGTKVVSYSVDVDIPDMQYQLIQSKSSQFLKPGDLVVNVLKRYEDSSQHIVEFTADWNSVIKTSEWILVGTDASDYTYSKTTTPYRYQIEVQQTIDGETTTVPGYLSMNVRYEEPLPIDASVTALSSTVIRTEGEDFPVYGHVSATDRLNTIALNVAEYSHNEGDPANNDINVDPSRLLDFGVVAYLPGFPNQAISTQSSCSVVTTFTDCSYVLEIATPSALAVETTSIPITINLIVNGLSVQKDVMLNWVKAEISGTTQAVWQTDKIAIGDIVSSIPVTFDNNTHSAASQYALVDKFPVTTDIDIMGIPFHYHTGVFVAQPPLQLHTSSSLRDLTYFWQDFQPTDSPLIWQTPFVVYLVDGNGVGHGTSVGDLAYKERWANITGTQRKSATKQADTITLVGSADASKTLQISTAAGLIDDLSLVFSADISALDSHITMSTGDIREYRAPDNFSAAYANDIYLGSLVDNLRNAINVQMQLQDQINNLDDRITALYAYMQSIVQELDRVWEVLRDLDQRITNIENYLIAQANAAAPSWLNIFVGLFAALGDVFAPVYPMLSLLMTGVAMGVSAGVAFSSGDIANGIIQTSVMAIAIYKGGQLIKQRLNSKYNKGAHWQDMVDDEQKMIEMETASVASSITVAQRYDDVNLGSAVARNWLSRGWRVGDPDFETTLITDSLPSYDALTDNFSIDYLILHGFTRDATIAKRNANAFSRATIMSKDKQYIQCKATVQFGQQNGVVKVPVLQSQEWKSKTGDEQYQEYAPRPIDYCFLAWGLNQKNQSTTRPYLYPFMVPIIIDAARDTVGTMNDISLASASNLPKLFQDYVNVKPNKQTSNPGSTLTLYLPKILEKLA